MALLDGRLMGDNVAETTRMSEKQMQSLAKEARQFVVEYVDLLFGPAHTTKVHRFANHLLAALLRNGNLWECDTSENEALHGPCKKMYARTNKRGPSIVLQMMRAAENQAEVLRELRLLNDEDEDGGGGVNHLLLLSEDIVDGVDVGTAPTLSLSRSSRGLQTSVAEVEQLPGMALLGLLLGNASDYSLVVSSSFTFHCSFE